MVFVIVGVSSWTGLFNALYALYAVVLRVAGILVKYRLLIRSYLIG